MAARLTPTPARFVPLDIPSESLPLSPAEYAAMKDARSRKRRSEHYRKVRRRQSKISRRKNRGGK